MKIYKRICENCGKELVYGSYSAYFLANKNNSVCRNCATRKCAKRMCDVTPLLQESHISYYWMGFLLADGHFSNNRIKICLSERDKSHIEKFAKFINYKSNILHKTVNGHNEVYISAKHTPIVNDICEKFDIKNNKTKNPPKTILNHKKEFLISLICGFIDGDGNISRRFDNSNLSFIRIKTHSSWLKILKEFCEIIGYNPDYAKINNQGYASLYISDSKKTSFLKKHIIKYKLPVLDRKWNKINENFSSRYEKSKFLKEEVIKLLKEGVKQKDIANSLGISRSCVYKIKNKYYV